MPTSTDTLDEELQILFGALCDGLRQEVRTRHLANLVINKKQVPLATSLTQGREQELSASLAYHLRSVGFFVQTESYFATSSVSRRPDFRVWLPVNCKYLYLELKPYGWGEGYSYDYATIWTSIKNDLDKLMDGDLPNGLAVVGFSKPNEQESEMPLCKAYEDLGEKIVREYPFQKVGVQVVDLQDMDSRTSYRMVGLWVRKS